MKSVHAYVQQNVYTKSEEFPLRRSWDVMFTMVQTEQQTKKQVLKTH